MRTLKPSMKSESFVVSINKQKYFASNIFFSKVNTKWVRTQVGFTTNVIFIS